MNNKDLVVERLLHATIDRVWKAISKPEELRHWFFNLKEFKPEVGFQFSFTAGHKEQVQYTHITEVIPLKRLSYSWRYEGYPGISTVIIELLERNERLYCG
ncbi:SRPBCC family protein [Parafilimonas sp.]|uniref:SRPBCC family protein n=1 Tax=Parafilimonas sp. TaxID=1969739 RepID=UPI003F7D594B